MNFGQIWIFVIFKRQYFSKKKRIKSGKKVPMSKNKLKSSTTNNTKHATSMLSRSVGFRSPPQKGGYVFLDFFHGFLRWGHEILHADYNGLSRPSGRILAGRMPFPATNRILNFIFLQKFLAFCPFLTIFFLSEPKSNQVS